MENIFMIDKNLMKKVIATLKNLDVRGFESMDALVGCVLVLEQAMNPPAPTNETVEITSMEKGE